MDQSIKSQKNSLESKSLEHHLHPYTNPELVAENGPQIIQSGDGVRVSDIDGNSYIEGMSGLWCASLGFSEKQLVDAALNQMNTLPFYHSFAGKVPDVSVELAEKLVSIVDC